MSAGHDVFVYGTLTIPEVVRAVLGRDWPLRAAVLEGHARYALRDATYPAAVAEPGAEVPGCLLLGIDEAALARLDRFESAEYRRARVRVRVEAGGERDAWVWLLNESHRHRLSDGGWDRAQFVARHLAAFLGSGRG